MKEYIALLVIFLTSLLYSAEVYLDATKYRQDFGKIVITSDELKNFPNIQEVFLYHNIDIYCRSFAQYDISLNGGTFEQVKILLNGITICDPQTGHHNCNIPLSIEDVEYIEITKTDNFAKYGNIAFSGLINIVPKTTTKQKLNFSYGSFNTSRLYIGLPFSYNGYLSLQYLNSDGYKDNTDFNSYNIFYNTTFNNTNFLFGYIEKKFGAQDFYAPPSRKEYEHTKTLLASFSRKFYLFDINLFLRSGYDFYTTYREDPQKYSNYHNSYVYGFNLKGNTFYKNIIIQPMFELLIKRLDSKGFSTILTNWQGLGAFCDYETHLGSNFLFNFKTIFLETTILANYYSRYLFIPQFGSKLDYFIDENTKLFVSASQVHRIPSYTELYYWDPTHQAADTLKVEKTLMYQIGLNKNFDKNFNFSVAGFKYEPFDIIDWMRTKNDPTARWNVTNIAKAQTYGCNLSLGFSYKKLQSKILYTFTEKEFELDSTKELKYVENYPKHNLNVNISVAKILGFNLSMLNSYRYLTKTQPKEVFLSSFILDKTIKNFKIKTSVENLFDIKYEELPGLQAPPRTYKVGVTYYL